MTLESRRQKPGALDKGLPAVPASQDLAEQVRLLTVEVERLKTEFFNYRQWVRSELSRHVDRHHWGHR